jgi:hypothetical protein
MIDAPPSAVGVWPWQAEPYRLWSLIDMQQFYCSTFFTVATHVESARHTLALRSSDAVARSEASEAIAEVVKEMTELPLALSVQRAADRLLEHMKDSAYPRLVLVELVAELQHHLQAELAQHLFLFVPSSRKFMFGSGERWFGEEALTAFPDARRDMRDCARCLALDQWTASVYHAMCVVQHGLHKLADLVGARFTREIDVLNWNDILKEIHIRLKAIADNEPKTAERDAKLKLGADAAAHFFAIKEAWRNHVMHGRDRYDEADAWPIVDAVRAIMKALA